MAETGEGGSGHAPVLLAEALEALSPRAGDVYVDATAGLGGHASAFASRVAPGGVVVVNDLDAGHVALAVGRVREAVGEAVRVEGMQGNFAEIPRKLVDLGLKADVVLADLGFASPQVDEAGRGFSFKWDGPLDMRYDRGGGVAASELVNTLSEGELAALLWEFGEERRSRAVARAIVRARGSGGIETTGRLAEVVRSVVGASSGGVDGATRTFQALRIAVNDELGSLDALLAAVERGARGRSAWLGAGARVGVICFHSLEDRRVKRGFGALVSDGLAEGITRKPIEAGSAEVAVNARARSAKLRAVRVTGPM